MSGIPDGWAVTTLQELAGPAGLMDDGDWIESKDQDPNGEVRLIQLADIGDGHFIDKSSRFLNTAKAAELRCTYLRAGDLLIARMPDPLGRSCIFPEIEKLSVTAVDVCIWRPTPDTVDPRWLMHFVNSPEVRDAIQSQASGTTRQRVSGGNLKRLSIPVPPAREQRRIVAKLDSLRARSARARDELGHIPKLIERYKQAILAKAFSGELTADWRDTRTDKRGWSRKTVGALATDIRYGTAAKCDYQMTSTPVLRIPNIGRAGICLDDLKYAEFTEAEIRKLSLQTGDLLFIRSNGSLGLVGRAAVVSDREAGLLYAGYLIRVRLDQTRVLPRFILHLFSEPATRRHIESLAKSTSGVNNINSEQLAAVIAPVPTISEQHEIVRRIDAAFSWLDRVSSEHAQAEHLLPKLDQAILAKAFRGELVPQNPNDEPASALLERIKAERGEQSQKRGRARSA